MAELLIGIYLLGLGYSAGWIGLPRREFGAWVDCIFWPLTWPAGKVREVTRCRGVLTKEDVDKMREEVMSYDFEDR